MDKTQRWMEFVVGKVGNGGVGSNRIFCFEWRWVGFPLTELGDTGRKKMTRDCWKCIV